MGNISVDLLDEFHFGDPAVVLAMDSAGLDFLIAALDQTLRQGHSRIDQHDRTHTFLQDPGAADIRLGGDLVEWRLDRATIVEMVDLLTALRSAGRPGHHYVDIHTPADTLVLSVDEDLGARWQ